MKKRMLTILLALALVLSFAACAGKEEDSSTPNDGTGSGSTVGSGANTESTGSTVATKGDETQPTETTEPTTSTDGTEVTEPSEDVTEPSTQPTETVPPETEPSTQPTETVPPETEPTEGTKENPISCYPDNNQENPAFTTITLPQISGGSSLYFNVYRIGGREIVIEDSDAYVIYNGTKYTAKNGKVQFTTEEISAEKAQLMEIGNTGSSTKVFKLNCQSPVGTYENPVKVDAMNGDSHSAHIAKNDEQGYYFFFTADKNGTIKLVLESASNGANVGIRAMNHNTMRSESNTEGNEFAGMDYIELAVSAGDEIEISVFAQPNDNWEFPETDVVWSGSYKD